MKKLIIFIFSLVLAIGLIPVSVSYASEAPTELSISCSASLEYADYGDSVTWTSEVSGGVAPFTYNWSGDDSLSGDSANVSKTYSEAGDKSAQVIVTDAEANTAVADCAPVVVVAPLTFNSCSANENNGMTGQTITWSADISGGVGPYNFSWSGTDGLSGNDSTVTIVYSATGTKVAQLGPISDSRGTTIAGDHACSAPVNIFYEPSTMTASCSVNETSVKTGDNVTWSTDISGGDAPYTVEWTGTDDLSTTGASVSKEYSNTGTKTASIKVTSADGQTLIGIACGSVDVTRRSSSGGGSSSSGSVPTGTNTGSATTTTDNGGVVAGVNNEGGLNEELLLGNGNTLPLLVKEDVKAGDKSTTTATSTASTSENILEGQTAGLSSLFFANGNFSWVSLLVLALIILGLLLVIWFFLIRKKGDEENKTPEVK